MRISTIRGMKDYFGKEAVLYNSITQGFLHMAKNCGFNLISTPILEKETLFTTSLGETTDVVSKEMYAFSDNNGEKMVLRPEGTASVVRALIENSLYETLPAKFAYFGPMFRYERPQKGRRRQFHQLGIECFSNQEKEARDAEAIILADTFLKSLGLEDIALKINTLGSIEDRRNYLDALRAYLSNYKSDLSEISLKRLDENPLRILDSKEAQDQEIIKNAPRIIEFLSEESRNFFETVLNLLKNAGINFKVDQHIVRGLDYYTHTIFEFTTDRIGSQSTVLAGGRYDNFVKLFDGPDLSGIGWAAGFERLSLLLNEGEGLDEPYTVAVLSDEAPGALALTGALRENDIRTEFFIGNSFKKLISKADKINAKLAIFYGSNERETGLLSVKNLANASQENIPYKQIINYIKNNMEVT